MNAVAFAGVTLRRGGRVVIEQADLAIAEGEFVGILGPNGAGKTTLMRAILGLVQPSAGSIRVFGAAASPGAAAIGYMPQVRQDAGLRLSGYDFVACAADGRRWGLPVLSRAARLDVERALDQVDATALAGRALGELSGGERQRLLLAQALLGQPRLLLLDEPLLSLDPRHQGNIVALVRGLQRELGITVLFSAHELNPLLGAIDRVLYLARGRAVLGTVADVVTAPVLSALYDVPVDVVHAHGRVFVLPGAEQPHA